MSQLDFRLPLFNRLISFDQQIPLRLNAHCIESELGSHGCHDSESAAPFQKSVPNERLRLFDPGKCLKKMPEIGGDKLLNLRPVPTILKRFNSL